MILIDPTTFSSSSSSSFTPQKTRPDLHSFTPDQSLLTEGIMEALFYQFTLLSDQSLRDKNFDPAAIEDLMKLFEVEAYKSWAAAVLEHEEEAQEAEAMLDRAEEYLDSVMDDAMDEFRRFEEEMDRMAEEELRELVDTAERARRMGSLMEKAATVASKKYMEAALNSALASMKSAWKGLNANKVHPS